MHWRQWEIFLCVGIISAVVLFIIFYPINEALTNENLITNNTIFTSLIGFKVKDESTFTALLIGISTILITLYTTERSYRLMRLSSIPDKSADLILNIEFEFNEYNLYKQKNRADEIILLIQILKYWREHQKAFRILTPKFYKNFVKLISTSEIINNNDFNFEKNSKYIINAILTQITKIALEKDTDSLCFIDPYQIKDNIDIEQKGSMKHLYIEIKLNKNDLNEYINAFNGENTKNCALEKFETLCDEICSLLNNLKTELEEYD